LLDLLDLLILAELLVLLDYALECQSKKVIKEKSNIKKKITKKEEEVCFFT